MARESDQAFGFQVFRECGSRIKQQYNYCEKCGTPIDMPQTSESCDNCGATLYPEDRFCTKCGSPLHKQPIKPFLPNAAKAVLAIALLIPVAALAYYQLWGWVSVGVGLWLLGLLTIT